MTEFETTYRRWKICETCQGEGVVENPSFSNGFTSSEWAEMSTDDDEDGVTQAQRYLAGAYDVPCRACEGRGKVKAPDMDAMPLEEKNRYQAYLKQIREDQYWRQISHQEALAERRMGA